MTPWTWLAVLVGIGAMTWLQLLSREPESRSSAVKRLLLKHSAEVLVQGGRPRILYSKSDGREKYSKWHQRKAVVDARRKAGRLAIYSLSRK